MAPAALVFAGKTVAASVIKEIIGKALGYLSGYFSAENMQEMRSKLDSGMPKIQAVLQVVTPDQFKDKSEALDDWFWQLRAAVEAAEDAIDELEYYELEEKANDRMIQDEGSSLAKMKHKLAKSVKHVGVLDKVAKQFTHRDTIKRLKKAMESLEKAAADITSILAVTEFLNGAASGGKGHGDVANNCRETGSMLTATMFVGREVEKQIITEWLTNMTSVEEPEIAPSTGRIPILSTVGHGGMGKTALIQSILENKNLQDFKKIWVTVSTDFDATTVISKILESVMRTAPSAKHLEPLQKMLQEELLSVKFLLILDDVWEEEKTSEWEKLFAPLRTGKSGSKILLTTRMASVAELAAKAMGVKKNLLTLEGLKEDQCLELFNHHVFSGLNSHEYEQLIVIGEQIARKLGGCPLVTKVASGHLQGNMTFEYWNNFLHKGLEHFKGTREDILSVLRLSYYHLPAELQICLRYCSLFPEDYEFEKEKLVQLWMGSGLISCPGRDSLTFEEIGEQRLARLTKKSFFDLHLRVSSNGSREEYYVMHDLIHALAVHVSFGECAMITGPARLQAEKDTVRHIHIPDFRRISVEDVKQMSRFKNLRSIIINFDCYQDADQNIVSAFGRVVESSKTLRLFHSGLLHTSHFDDKLGNLKHLRYICLSRISPEGICGVVKLYHLMLLHCYCSNTNTKQVRYVGNLDNLRYVFYGVNLVGYGLGEFPVSRLTHLRKLNNYWIGGTWATK